MIGGGETEGGQGHHSPPCMSLLDNTYDRSDSIKMSLSEWPINPALFTTTFS